MSNFEGAIQSLAKRVEEYSETIQTEEAVKTSVVLPFLQALGYDVFNPAEVVPEFTADAVGKKGEKVDYAILRQGEVSILIECKGLNAVLTEKHLAQLFRYFTVTSARFAVLTNGREYRFYSDLEESNKLDRKPFFVFDLLDYANSSLGELSKFSKADFNVENILEQAERLKYVAAVKSVLNSWMESPPEALVKLVAPEVYEGRLNGSVRESIASAIASAFREIVRDRLRLRISSALEDTPAVSSNAEQPAAGGASGDDIEMTQEELEGWLLIKSILRGTVDAKRVDMRDAKSYCAILLDNNNRKPLVRLHFNRTQKYVGLFDGEEEQRVPVESLDDILEHSERIRATAKKYA
ncbi:type I restriction endonuclease [Seohaeicola zhoushanensis]|uniref:Restriction endonuclease or methylase n=1 Tax=Seohaeicola zhoushanensis TaxID=1569283 RepID=A0A8J3H3E9_9RHOB|nr:type I restriction endonuclease [Seohaeicola zhoushanensis]GHF73488.1 restriction endonuclease or methylase [Seohaeicola zhoushanensis]